MAIIETFPVESQGIGRVDYTLSVERSTEALSDTHLRQGMWGATWGLALPTLVFPHIYEAAQPMPQEDGTWDYLASSVTMHFMELSIGLETNVLVFVQIFRYASLEDYYHYIIAQRFPGVYGYGQASIEYKSGIPTQPGSLYSEVFGFWSPNPTEYITANASGIFTDLTPPFMVP